MTTTPDLADHRPDIYTEDGRRIFRASSFGGCDGNLVRAAVGLTPSAKPDWLTEAYKVSAGHEGSLLRGASKKGWKMLDGLVLEQYGEVDGSGQLALELNVPGKGGGIIRCHPDAIGQCFKAKLDGSDSYKVQDRAVVEAKAMSDKSGGRGTLDSSEFYRWQTSIEMACTGLPLLFIVGRKDDDGELIRVDGEPDLAVAYLTTPFYSKAQIFRRVRHLNRLIDAYDAGEGLPACTWKQYPCPFYAEHDRKAGIWMEAEVPELKGALKFKVRRMAEKVAELEREYKGLEVQIKERKADLLELVAGNDIRGKVDAGHGVYVTRVVKAGALSFKKDLAVADVGQEQVDKWYRQNKPSDYVTVEVES